MPAPKKPAPPRKKLLIVDDHPMMRQGLAQLINAEPDLCVCGEAGDAHQALELVAARRPDLLLADLTMPGKSGLELIKDLQARHPDLPVLALSMHDEAIYTERVLRAGGRGYIMKQEGGRKILEAIRRVLAGQVYVSELMSAKILDLFSGRRSGASASPMEKLTDREFDVFQLIGRGKGTQQIARDLHISVKTVEVHRLNIKTKLKLATASELVHFAVRWMEARPHG